MNLWCGGVGIGRDRPQERPAASFVPGVTFSVGPHTARRADMIGQVGLGPARRSPSVADFGAFPPRQGELLSRSEGEPGPRLAAQRTVATQAALVEIKIDFVTHTTAVA